MTTHFNKWRMVVSKSIFLYFYGLFEERFSGTTNNRKEKNTIIWPSLLSKNMNKKYM